MTAAPSAASAYRAQLSQKLTRLLLPASGTTPCSWCSAVMYSANVSAQCRLLAMRQAYYNACAVQRGICNLTICTVTLVTACLHLAVSVVEFAASSVIHTGSSSAQCSSGSVHEMSEKSSSLCGGYVLLKSGCAMEYEQD
eukprot:19546-Heterococcus_DN1.PRE.1